MALLSTAEAFGRQIVPSLIPLALKYELPSTSAEQIVETVHFAPHRKLAYVEISY